VTDALNAAAAPGQPHEIAGAYAAAQRLAAARRWPVGQPARSRRPVIGWSKAFFLKIAVIAVAFVGGGWALAATTGILPDPLVPHSPATPSAGGGDGQTPTSSPGPTSSNPTPSTGPPASATVTAGVSPPATPGLVGQCEAVLRRNPDRRSQLLDTPAYADLVAAAGGKDKVTEYCRAHVGGSGTTPPAPSPSPTANRPDQPSDPASAVAPTGARRG
jgi:hypothetical protein